MRMFMIAVFMEFIGTMLFQLYGGTPFSTYTNGGVQNGIILAVIVYITGEWSGGHVNPAVTLGLTISGNCEWYRMLAYWVVQFTGAILGAALTTAFIPAQKFGQNSCMYVDGSSQWT